MSEIALIVKGKFMFDFNSLISIDLLLHTGKVITRVGENESQNEVVANEGDILRYERGVKVWQYTDVETTSEYSSLHPSSDYLPMLLRSLLCHSTETRLARPAP